MDTYGTKEKFLKSHTQPSKNGVRHKGDTLQQQHPWGSSWSSAEQKVPHHRVEVIKRGCKCLKLSCGKSLERTRLITEGSPGPAHLSLTPRQVWVPGESLDEWKWRLYCGRLCQRERKWCRQEPPKQPRAMVSALRMLRGRPHPWAKGTCQL